MALRFIYKRNPEDFELIRNEVERVVTRACHGEFTADDVKRLIADGKAYAVYVINDGKVEIACVWELIYYPHLQCVNVMALGGSHVREQWAENGSTLKELWRKQGAKAWQCEASKAMTRLLQRSGTGLKPVYITSRQTL